MWGMQLCRSSAAWCNPADELTESHQVTDQRVSCKQQDSASAPPYIFNETVKWFSGRADGVMCLWFHSLRGAVASAEKQQLPIKTDMMIGQIFISFSQLSFLFFFEGMITLWARKIKLLLSVPLCLTSFLVFILLFEAVYFYEETLRWFFNMNLWIINNMKDMHQRREKTKESRQKWNSSQSLSSVS